MGAERDRGENESKGAGACGDKDGVRHGANNVSEYDYDKSFGTSADPERHRDMRIPINQLVFPV